MRLSILDQIPVAEGSDPRDALQQTLSLARLAERIGFYRYWVAEHHGTPSLACTTPEVMVGAIAGTTRAIRVGSGGVMLPHYSPYKVAETFSMLSGLYPERIDLGIGRAAGTDPATARALQRDRRLPPPDDFPEQLAELLGYFEGTSGDDSFSRLARHLPGQPSVPEPWLLGSSPQSAIWAAAAGLPYAFADFINPSGAGAARRYREEFTPSRWQSEPYVIASIWVTCAETDQRARDLSASARMVFRLLFRGKLIPVPTVEKALAFLDQEPGSGGRGKRRRNIVGGPSTVAEQIATVEHEYQADEVMIVTMTWDPEARERSYELIAEQLLS